MKSVNKVLLTGATGFVGSRLLGLWLEEGRRSIVVGSRSDHADIGTCCQVFNLGGFGADTVWHDALAGVDCVVHLAGRAHVMSQESNALALFRESNTEATLNLARQAAAQGVQRFVFISSIGVNGALTTEQPFSETSVPSPHADYAVSKLEAETGLMQLSKTTEMEIVIIRPPLVYAAHAPGNFRRLLKLVHSGIPLPFGRVKNSRSMIALENLVDLISVCVDHPAAANQVFLASDGVNFSTAQIIDLLAKGMGRKVRLIPLPVGLLRVSSKLLGKPGLYTQLCGSLQIDSSKARQLLGWVPPVPAETAMIKAGQAFSNKVVGS
ncbi:NAD-dependent epimerase/dehydratase family protein [Pseudomonas extremorientalis]|uniref:NAD-dependent dehydratase n=1 Tax=Pseudomonas extremorientalis TaxID=169669 RepID=A0A1H0W0K2_9PSED|nr:NAD-dependent epimerase/dehydratase family protein [Pseudomonas extremorientalis]KAB0518340.1 NAD-dependent epimerase/dehydratase family protein [Pseudomonas extremorientalis]OIN11877.1 NAD-dependent dehydratase [Pseudomonas extremorientalis]SDP84297.1 Nucleoside-diphosphate-sugar epimerase [Pseudomonas extremorientalis]